ncbi:hypothetical protein E2P81_ATG03600 [Venturia nashicola]|uniref:BTB domain-containing protein n=1 Tax=Venturia nashicola TaxID=86259 RepID=A0A4Z1PJ84_9PEZI|nr:hypothetical protein E6O75_ATG03674 [Venturia nashicola]TLD37925.1 hypothetical protein E2P81_ATG03600 [Venturia nashicola]
MATIQLRDGGDLTLIVGEQKQRYVVCRRTISGVCKPWNTMFTKFSEACAAEVELPDDNPEAILILLRVAHLRFDQLPAGKLSVDEVNNLATVCDKYDAVGVIRPFLTTWVTFTNLDICHSCSQQAQFCLILLPSPCAFTESILLLAVTIRYLAVVVVR